MVEQSRQGIRPVGALPVPQTGLRLALLSIRQHRVLLPAPGIPEPAPRCSRRTGAAQKESGGFIFSKGLD